MDQVRKNAQKQMIATIGQEKWDEHMVFIGQMRQKLADHKIHQHPVMKKLEQGRFSFTEMQTLHMEFREMVLVFTDVLLMAMYQSLQLDKSMKPGMKAYPRFLITLNLFDEFGFWFDESNSENNLIGSPEASHLALFENLLAELDITDEDREEYVSSDVTMSLITHLSDAYEDLPMLVTILALAEENVMVFAPYMRQNCKKFGVPVDTGYYHVHGASDDGANEGRDDFHQNDLWLILAQIMGDYDRNKLFDEVDSYMDKWVAFWDQDFTYKLVKSAQEAAELKDVAA